MYKFIEFEKINSNMEDGKYFTIAKVKEVLKDSIILEKKGKQIKFFSIYKPKENSMVRVFFVKDKENFTIDFLQTVDEQLEEITNLFINTIRNYV